jgi:hypothetical protein
LIAAVAAVPVAIVMTIVAVDVLRTPGWISTDDARFQTAPLRAAGLWNEPGLLATRARIRTLGIDGDLAYRVIGVVREAPTRTASQLVDPGAGEPVGEAPVRADDGSRENPDAAPVGSPNLLGVLLLARYLYASPDQRTNLLTNAIGSFRTAVELDSRNDDAKVNLEMALRAYGPTLFPSNAPDTGDARGQKSGQGRAGSGY